MLLTVTSENEDGSANCSVDLSHEEANYLINYAIVNMLKKGLTVGKACTVTEDCEEEQHSSVINTLKETLVSTYLYKFIHDEDIVHNLRVRRGCKALLRHFMIPALAEKYIAQIEAIHEDGDDD